MPAEKWSPQRVIAAIRDRHRRGLPLTHVWRDWPALYRAAQTYCGSWQAAKEVAGNDLPGGECWSPGRVLTEIQTWYREPAHEQTPMNAALARAAHFYFGSWKNAVLEAGLTPCHNRKWTPKRIIQSIQDLHVRGECVGRPGRRNRSLVSAARHYFGNWKSALTAAGLEHCYPQTAPPRRWTRQFGVDEIQAIHRRGIPVSHIWREFPTLYRASKKQFGRWEIALQAAGFQPTRRKWSQQTIVAEIRDRFRRGLSLSSHARENRNLAMAARWYFGSWRKAKAAAGVCLARIHTHCECQRKAG